MDTGTLIGIIGVLTALITAGATALKLRRDAHRDDLKVTSDLYEQVSADLERRMQELQNCYDSRDELRKRLDESERRLTIGEEREDDCNRRLSRVESILPFVLAEDQALDHNTFGWLLDESSDGWVISLTAGEGTWVYVNRVMCKALGMTAEDILAKGWRNLIHPDDLSDTVTAEAKSWNERVTIVNRYIGNNGVITVRWFARYRKGQCLALARII